MSAHRTPRLQATCGDLELQVNSDCVRRCDEIDDPARSTERMLELESGDAPPEPGNCINIRTTAVAPRPRRQFAREYDRGKASARPAAAFTTNGFDREPASARG